MRKSISDRFMERARTRREDLGITQCKLAQQLMISQAALSTWETGRRSSITLDEAARISDLLGVDLADMIR